MTINVSSYRYGHVVMYMIMVAKMEKTRVQIWLHDYFCILIAKC